MVLGRSPGGRPGFRQSPDDSFPEYVVPSRRRTGFGKSLPNAAVGQHLRAPQHSRRPFLSFTAASGSESTRLHPTLDIDHHQISRPRPTGHGQPAPRSTWQRGRLQIDHEDRSGYLPAPSLCLDKSWARRSVSTLWILVSMTRHMPPRSFGPIFTIPTTLPCLQRGVFRWKLSRS